MKTLLPRPLLQKARAATWRLRDIRYGLRTGEWNLPPAYLRVKVCGTIAPEGYTESGMAHARMLMDVMRQAGADPNEFQSVLDFGCGCGRILSALQTLMPQAQFTGTDAEADLIEWPRAHLKQASFGVNTPEPPLPYPDSQFDLIYAYSVFTHLDERLQFLWLEELRRVAKPGAMLILTVHGTSDENKFEFVKNDAWSDFFPDHYHTTFHGRAYVQKHWSRYFTIAAYVPETAGRAQNPLPQDAVVLRNAP